MERVIFAPISKEGKEHKKKEVFLDMGIYGNDLSIEQIQQLFSDMLFFTPKTMGVRTGHRRYKQMIFNENIVKCYGINGWSTCIQSEVQIKEFENSKFQDWDLIDLSVNEMRTRFFFHVTGETWDKHKDEIMERFQKNFVELGGCFAFAVSCFDHFNVQNPKDVDVYNQYLVDDTDFAGVRDIPIIPKKHWLWGDTVDLSYLPGRMQQYGGMNFTSAPYMLIGPDFYEFFSREAVEKFDNCEENTEIAEGYRMICLNRDVRDYNAPVYRDRQWDFRRKMKFDEIIPELSSKPFRYKNGGKGDPEVEFFTGQFSHGGELLMKVYQTSRGKQCQRSRADKCIIRELKGNDVVWEEKQKLI